RAGCFQCSKRRIICDGLQPICSKCQKKGIECSGQGRIRFSNAVALRGKFKGCAIPVAGMSGTAIIRQPQQEPIIQPMNIRWKNDQKSRVNRKSTKRRANPTECEPEKAAAIRPRARSGPETQHNTDHQDEKLPSQTNMKESVVEALTPKRSSPSQSAYPADLELIRRFHGTRHGGNISNTASNSIRQIPQWIAPLNSDTRMLFSHFAQEVAPVMVILDSVSNGYRDVLLPLACEDDLLQHAICVVATQHLALHNTYHQHAADQSRAAVISRLRRESLQSCPDRIFNVSTWATLIILLVGETITGSSECGHMLQILISLAWNVSQKTPSELSSFLLQQTHMFQLLGQPLLGTTAGCSSSLNLPIHHYLDWTYYDIPSNSEHCDLLRLSRDAFMKAFQIYTGRRTGNDNQWELLESLKQVVCQVDPGQMGSHALVWVCFIGAADSADPAHRRFFLDRMSNIYAKTKFQNIAAGMRALPGIWSEQSSSKWTEDLFRLAPTLVI
ncbi:uncharacterized protein N7506_011462, partial [Penicillium brevicompactum]|uniref:uncharacterized protein n=1 Tax=Penicillium brevicompactum TaxID=5074 RepID=UPI002540B0E3